MQKLSKQQGLTLLEVLIALSVIAIALMAIIKVTGENIRGNNYLREKNIANWIALNVMNKTRLGLIQLPEAPENNVQEEWTLNQPWQWQGSFHKTANPRIREMHVTIFHQPNHQKITELTSYVYAP